MFGKTQVTFKYDFQRYLAHDNTTVNDLMMISYEVNSNDTQLNVNKNLNFRSISLFTWRYLADCCWMPTIALVTIWTLNENSTIAETLGEHLATDVVKSDTFACNGTIQYVTN